MSQNTLEHCCECDLPTGNAGIGDGSLYHEDGRGPFCESCFAPYPEENHEIEEKATGKSK